MKMTKKGYDVLGCFIELGDFVVYGALKGRSAGLNLGRVIEINGDCYTVKSVQVSWGEYRPAAKLVTLQYSERMCVIPETSVSNDILKLLGEC